MTRSLRPRVPGPTDGSWCRSAPVALALTIAALLAPLAGVPDALAADGDRAGIEAPLLSPDPNTLDLPTVDVAVLRAEAPDVPLRILRLRTPEAGQAILELLSPGIDGWVVADRSALDLGGLDPATVPWFLRLGDTARFVVVAADAAGRETRLLRLDVVGTRIVAGPSTELAGAVTGGGAADVDADGSIELVLAGPPQPGRTPGSAGGCATVLHVFDSVALAHQRRIELGPIRLGGIAFAELDGLPGLDLAASIAARCPGGQRVHDGVTEVAGGLLGIRLADGALLGSVGVDGRADPLVGPLPLRLAGSATDLLVTTDGERTVLVDPAAGWTMAPVAEGATRPLGVVSPAGGRGASRDDALVAVVRLGAGPSTGLELVGVAPGTEGPVVTPRRVPDVAGLGDWLATRTAGREGSRWPASWSGDVDGDGCPELVVPLLVVSCATSPDATARHGPAWIATRPLAVLEGSGSRLLVASSLAWDPAGDGLLDPSPLPVAAAVGGWRSGPSGVFALAELPADDLLYFADFPTPIPTVDETTGRQPLESVVAARAGDRVLARWHPIGADEEATPIDDPSVGEVLRQPPGSGERVLATRAPVRDGGLSGVEIRSIHVPLATGDGGLERAWRIDVVGLNDWGEASAPVAAVVALDVLGPSLVVDVPFVSAPWPFRAPITGRAEPGSTVGLVGQDPTDVANRIGQFTLRTSLAPWPQDVEVRAVDAEGNETIQRISVIGGIDVRRLPWQVLVAIGVLAAVAWTAFRGAGGRPQAVADRSDRPGRAGVARWALGDDDVPDGWSVATIEDLDPSDGPLPRRTGRSV